MCTLYSTMQASMFDGLVWSLDQPIKQEFHTFCILIFNVEKIVAIKMTRPTLPFCKICEWYVATLYDKNSKQNQKTKTYHSMISNHNHISLKSYQLWHLIFSTFFFYSCSARAFWAAVQLYRQFLKIYCKSELLGFDAIVILDLYGTYVSC